MPAIFFAALLAQDLARLDIVVPNPRPVSDSELVAFVEKPFDPMSERRGEWPRALGMHHGTQVVVTYTCSDVCPKYTKRIVRYNVYAGPGCERIGGVSKDIVVPRGIGAGRRRFCLPAVIANLQE